MQRESKSRYVGLSFAVAVLLLAADGHCADIPINTGVKTGAWSSVRVQGRFRNPDGRGHPDVPVSTMLAFYGRRVRSSLFAVHARLPARVRPDLDRLAAYGVGDPPTVTWIGHSTLLLQMSGVSFVTDPTWSSTASPLPIGPRRYQKPGLRIKDLPPVAFALVSHNHYDHMDLASLRGLADKGARIYVPLANAAILRSAGVADIVEMDWWQSVSVGPLTITCVPAEHWSQRGLFDRNRSLWSGWVVRNGTKTFYFAGDTGIFPGFERIRGRLGVPDLAALPIGAYMPAEIMKSSHLDPEQAVQAARRLQAVHSLAIHYGTFDLSDEPVGEPPERFAKASEAAGRGADRDWIVAIGETRSW